MASLTVRVQHEDFDIAVLQRQLLLGSEEEGAIATFTGYVRSPSTDGLLALELEHYPGMTQKSITAILVEASERWPLFAATVVHRVGKLPAGAQIVWVGCSSAHREAAFSACEFAMDYLKVSAPFWKKEWRQDGAHWLDARSADDARANRWKNTDT